MAEIIVKKKRGGVVEPFDREKIHAAIRKSADRVLLNLTDEDCNKVSDYVINHIKEGEVTVRTLHKIVEVALDETGFPKVAKSYRQYRNYKIDARKIMEAVDAKTLELTYKEDRSNANSDSLLVSTKRSILFGEMQKEKYKR
jgi:ribonucleoside-triphosphate reductase